VTKTAASKPATEKTAEPAAEKAPPAPEKSPASRDVQLHPATEALLKFFAYDHLTDHLQSVSRPFAKLARQIAERRSNAETTVALRKLLEAKDCAVRAVL
jgi:hypothetical protein